MDPFLHVWDIEDSRGIQLAALVVLGLLFLPWMRMIRRSWKKNGIKD